jgi:hypothetical protein
MAKRTATLSEDRRNKIFDAMRVVAIKELLSGTFVPDGWTPGQSAWDPTAWDALFGSESIRNRTAMLQTLEQLRSEFPDVVNILKFLREKWKK